MKKHTSDKHIWGMMVLLLLAAGIWFGAPPYYRYAAVFFAVLAFMALIMKRWTFWIVLGALIGCAVFLWSFRASGYHYTSALPLAGVLLMIVFRYAPRTVRRLSALVTVPAILLILAAEIPIVTASVNASASEARYIIVLGAAVYGETPSISLRHRSDRAVDHLGSNPGSFAVVSGGQGQGEDISEAECMRRYLRDKGVEDCRILLEDRSTSTLENLSFSKEVIEKNGGDPRRVAIVSSSYHLYRAERIASALGMQAEGVSSVDGYPVYMIGMYIREALAVWKLWITGVD